MCVPPREQAASPHSPVEGSQSPQCGADPSHLTVSKEQALFLHSGERAEGVVVGQHIAGGASRERRARLRARPAFLPALFSHFPESSSLKSEKGKRCPGHSVSSPTGNEGDQRAPPKTQRQLMTRTVMI